MTDQTITITVNGDPRDVVADSTLAHLVTELTGKPLAPDGTPEDGSRLGVAAAIDGAVVRRGQWAGHQLSAGQSVDIVTAVQGG